MMRLIEPHNLRWLEEAIIPDDINGDHELRRFGTTPIAAGEHEFTSYGLRQMIEAKALDYFQFDTNRVGGIIAARKIQALAEAYSIPSPMQRLIGRTKRWVEHQASRRYRRQRPPAQLLHERRADRRCESAGRSA
nr:hypothetical protein TQ38_22795 [Novosphingobium sp. P6W]